MRQLETGRLRVTRDDIAVIDAFEPFADQAAFLQRLIRRYLGVKIRRTFEAALESQPSVIDKTPQEILEEVESERNVAVSAALKPFRKISTKELYVQVMNRGRRLQYLPGSVQRDALNPEDAYRSRSRSGRTVAVSGRARMIVDDI